MIIRPLLVRVTILFSLIVFILPVEERLAQHPDSPEGEMPKMFPSDWLFYQRAYPMGTVDARAYGPALAFRRDQLANQQSLSRTGAINEPWQFSGPTNIGGRITDVERTTSSFSEVLYVGAASGGIFSTIDNGATWTPIFDAATNLSIGDIALAPSDEQVIYVGTGEANAGGGSIAYDGDGVYKSSDGGSSWTHLGLEKIGGVGRVLVHPSDPDKCYVGAMGRLFENNADRGLYRTEDGGQTWDQILYINDSTGIIDLVMHPGHPDTLYAAAWERVRRVNRNNYGGPHSGIYRTTNGGDTWEKLTNGLPAAGGRIGLAISASNPDMVMAFWADEQTGKLKGLYRSGNGGDSWNTINKIGIDDVSFMYWFGRIFIDPLDPDIIYVTSLEMFRSTDGGQTWEENFNGVHADQHDLWIDPDDPTLMYLGNDGGLYRSTNRGDNYIKMNGLPITQFYTSEIDYAEPYRLYGGTQDNGTMRTLTGKEGEYQRIYGGDGFRVRVDPLENTYVFAEYQYGNMARSIDGGNTFKSSLNGISSSDRKNWNTPFILHPQDPSILFYGSNRLYRSDDRAVSWTAISPDLTGNPTQQNLTYGTITSISVSPLDDQIIYIGTDVGLVQLSTDGGNTWNVVSDALPNRWVTSVTADPVDVNSAYVTFSGFRYGTNMGHIYKTENMGQDWMDFSGNFPDIPINDLVVIPDRIYLVIATDIGIYFSGDEGTNWELLGTDLPNLVITDLTWHDQEEILVAATYGRGMYTLDLTDVVSVRDEYKSRLELSVSPNPALEMVTFHVTLKGGRNYSTWIYSLEGKLVSIMQSGFLGSGKHDISVNTSGFESGVYLARIASEDGLEQGMVRFIRI
ncbi:MAG: T9SS type A sorting domain-containing protein [Saprospiraceae bacterium]|nr:T9SS type A sorting domain-containing protein [Saprospiraceae bacterium]